MRRCLAFLVISIIAVSYAMPANRALLVGIGKYDQTATGWNVIHGDKDVELLAPMLQKCGFTDIVTLINAQATKRAIVSALKDLAQRCTNGDKVYFHFSGHGQPIRDDNHDEGSNKKFDESIIPYDACRDSRKMNGTYEGQCHLIDDELCPLLNDIKKRLGEHGELFVSIDACYSKGIQKDEIIDYDPDLLKYVRGTNIAFTPKNRTSYLADIQKPHNFTIGAKMYVVAACGNDERNFEYKTPSGKMYGSLSYYIYTLLKTNADFRYWRQCFTDKQYLQYRIFRPIQHPSIEIYN